MNVFSQASYLHDTFEVPTS